MSQNQEIWIIAEFSNDLPFAKELYMHLNISGNPCIMSSSDEGFASESVGDVIYNRDPILAFQEMLGRLDKSAGYKLIIASHGIVLNGRHVFTTSLPEGSEYISVGIDSADLINSLNRDFKISETLMFSCFGSAIHKDLNPGPSKIYTLAEPESPCVTCSDIFAPGQSIASVKDVILRMSIANIYNGLGPKAFMDDVSIEDASYEATEQSQLTLHSHDNSINHLPCIMLSEDGKVKTFSQSVLEGDCYERALEIIPVKCQYKGLAEDLRAYFQKGLMPNLEGEDFEIDFFPMLKAHCCLLLNLTENSDTKIGDLCNGHSIIYPANDELKQLVFSHQSDFFGKRFPNFKLQRIGYEDVSKFDLHYTQIAMDFFTEDGGYNFEVYFFPLIESDGPVAVMASRHVSKEFKQKFFGEEKLADLFDLEHFTQDPISEQEDIIFGMLENSRSKMKMANQSSKPEFSSSAEACGIFVLKSNLLDIDLGCGEYDNFPEEISFACLRPHDLCDISLGQDIYKVDAQEWVFGQLSGRAVEWIDSLI